jgi:hypothetical protein
LAIYSWQFFESIGQLEDVIAHPRGMQVLDIYSGRVKQNHVEKEVRLTSIAIEIWNVGDATGLSVAGRHGPLSE